MKDVSMTFSALLASDMLSWRSSSLSDRSCCLYTLWKRPVSETPWCLSYLHPGFCNCHLLPESWEPCSKMKCSNWVEIDTTSFPCRHFKIWSNLEATEEFANEMHPLRCWVKCLFHLYFVTTWFVYHIKKWDSLKYSYAFVLSSHL